jgi:hypothetical protein
LRGSTRDTNGGYPLNLSVEQLTAVVARPAFVGAVAFAVVGRIGGALFLHHLAG